ncbi:MAG: translocation/assembly module TamB domain-containing protein [Bacteroidales bacterium]|nr:translocation/assembly module TamB domain-containing protein [Bacteroidales bacterium]
MNLEKTHNKKRYIKKTLKVLAYSFLGILLVIYLLIALINTSFFQSLLASKLSDYFSKEWGTELRISAVNINIFDRVELFDVYLEDRKGDTILFSESVRVKLKGLPSAKGINISNVNIKNTDFKLEIQNSELNFGFILDYFKSDKPKDKKKDKVDFVVKVDRIKMDNMKFSLRLKDNLTKYPEDLVALNNMRFRDIYADIRDIIVIGDSINLSFKNFKAKEHSSFEVKNIEGNFLVSSKEIRAEKAKIITTNSILNFAVKMNTTSWKTYSSFIDSVYCEGEIEKGSIAGMKDATYWAETIRGFHQKAEIEGKFSGKVNDLKFEDFVLSSGNFTKVKAKGSIIGLPSPENTVYDIIAEEITTSYKEYKSMRLGELLSNLPIPEMVDKLGKINFSGSFEGLISNFNAKGNLITDIGELSINGASIPQGGETGYKLKLISENFDVSTLFELEWVNTKNLDIDAFVVGNSLDNLSAELKGGFGNLNLMGNIYDTIFVNAQMLNKEIDANFLINDNSLKMDGIATVNLEDNVKLYLESRISGANPKEMNLFSFHDSTTTFSTQLIADIKDINPKTLAGNIELKNLRFDMEEGYHIIENLDAELSYNNSINSLIINSDILDLSLIGEYDFIGLGKDISYLIDKYVPNLNKNKNINYDSVLQNNNEHKILSQFELATIIKKPKPLFALFSPNIAISENTFIYSSINKDENLKLSVGTNELHIGSIYFREIILQSQINQEQLQTNILSNQFNITDSIYLKNLNINLKNTKDNLNLSALFNDKDIKTPTQGRLNFNSIIRNGILQGSFENSELELLGNRTFINNEHIISFNGEKIAILNFELFKEKENININGFISEKLNDNLKIDFNNVDISYFNMLLKDAGIELGGRLNEEINLKNLMDSPSITCDLIIDSLQINNHFLGRANIDISNTLSLDEFFVDISVLYKGKNNEQNMPLSVKGYIYPESLVNNLNLNLSMKDFNLGIIENYLSSFSSDFKGYLSGDNISVRGTFKQPNIQGKLYCRKGEINIDMINTKYYFSDTIKLDNNIFILNNFSLLDINKNPLTLNGKITHKDFQEFNIDLTAKANNVRVLNTNPSTDQMYFGSAFTSATAVLKGDLNFLKIDVNAKTEKGTKLTIPISSKTSVTQGSFIQFVEKPLPGEDKKFIPIKNKALNDKAMEYKIDVNLQVNPDAEISLPLNFTNLRGDLTASGEGELKIEIDDKGKFNMYGGVDISSGVFNMVLMNLVEKNFIIQKGGRIDWNGNPALGVIDAEAIYKTKASLAPILDIGKYSKPVDVQSVIMLSGSMMNPKPKFDIRLPNTDQQTIDQLFMTIDKNDEKQMLEQTVSLLVMKQFYVSTGGVSDSFRDTDLTSSAFEVAFGQISGMLSNMIKFVDVGVNYTPGTETFSDQVDVNLSKSIGRWDLVGDFVFGGKDMQGAENAGSFLGDISAEYKITENFRLKAFNRSNANDFTKYNITPYTQGVGITYKKQYESFEEMLNGFNDIFKYKRKSNLLK